MAQLSRFLAFVAGGAEFVVPFFRKVGLEFGRVFIGAFLVVFLGGLDAVVSALASHDPKLAFSVVASLIVSGFFAGAVAVVRGVQARATNLEPHV